jgi:hypothetical protein
LRRASGGLLKVRVLKDTFGWLPVTAHVKLRAHETTIDLPTPGSPLKIVSALAP